jgi:hypothetical protein
MVDAEVWVAAPGGPSVPYHDTVVKNPE